MVQPIEIATAVHNLCVEKIIPAGISPEHDVTKHAATTALYAEKINEAGLSTVTGEQVLQAILEATGWDCASPWPGHPSTESVIKALKGE